MALNFPSNPINGQTYGSYTYDATVGIWRSSSAGQGIVSTTTSAPTTAVSGDMWFNPNDGTMYVYYNDGTSGQWVESRAPITADGYQSPNYIINGGFDIWQRGNSFNGTTYNYGPDRWEVIRGAFTAGATFSRQTSGLAGTQYCMRIQRDSGNTSTQYILVTTPLETVSSIPLAGKTITFSFYARKGANFSGTGINYYVRSGLGTDQGPHTSWTGEAYPINTSTTLTDSWVRYSGTAFVPSTVTQLGVTFSYTPTGTAGTNDYFEIAGVQLEEGSVATPFRRNANSIQGELAACQRYYWRSSVAWSGNLYGKVSMGLFIGSTSGFIVLQLPVPLRVKPTAVEFSDLYLYDGLGSFSVTAATIDNASMNAVGVSFNIASGGTVTRACMLAISNSGGSNAYVGITAEL